jgi:phosphoribosylaminoimidazole-succinocarboxamide synthase
VRDVYEVDDKLLIVATDRISAFDVILADGVPGKGIILTQMSTFWFDLVKDIVPNHLVATDVDEYPRICQPHADGLRGRSMLVKKAEPLPVECIVRGYIAGSAWNEYKVNGTVCGIELPEGLVESDKFPEPLFTPSTKAELGDHDENISFEQMKSIVGDDMGQRLRDISITVYKRAAEWALSRGIILADTKFEFGVADGELILIDEIFTPDSSRFWLTREYVAGRGQESLDKQFVRDYLLSTGWDKTPPPPSLPEEVVDQTRERYLEAYRIITGKELELA